MTNDQEKNEVEVQEDTQEEVQEEQTQEEKKELTPEQQKGIAKRNLKKYKSEFPDLFEEDDSTEEEEEKKETKSEESELKLSPKDYLALKDVDEEDFDELVDFAKYKGISIKEAKNHPIMKATLEQNAEFRKTEEAKNTSKNKHQEQVSPGQVLKDAKAGKMPEPGSKEAEMLFNAKRGLKD